MEIPIEYLRECLEADYETGILTWKARDPHHFPTEQGWKTFNTIFAGKEAGSVDNRGYVRLLLVYEGRPHKLYAHRIIWAMKYGRWPHPNMQIDHRNRCKTFNAISNLREVTQSVNQHNRGPQKNNTSGIKGVSVKKKGRGRGRCWQAHFDKDGKTHNKQFPYTDEGKQQAIAQRQHWEAEYITGTN